MNRRCTGDVCLACAGARSVSLDLPLATVLMNPRQEWGMLAHGSRVRVARELDVDWKKYNQDNFLFSHCSIVASVEVGDNGYYIDPACSELVNNNGNAWSNEVLLATFKTFVGGENYLEHVQVPELSKGKILDAVLRPVHHKAKTGKTADIYFCDILVATSKTHDSLVKKIASGELTTMSMGCFKPGTLVLLADGTTKLIETFQGGERVITHTGGAERVVRPIKTHWRGDMWRIWVEGNPMPIECTGNHRFLQLTGRKGCLCGCGESLPHSPRNGRQSLMSSFIQGHKVRLMNPMVRYSEEERESRVAVLEEAENPVFDWISARELKEGALLAYPRMRDGKQGVSLGRARLLGLYLAEGNLVRQRGRYRAVEFSFSLAEKDTLALETKNLLADEMGVASSIYIRPSCKQCQVRTSWNQECVDWFERFGGHYSWAKKLDPEVMNWNNESLKCLVGGWADGDGCLDSKNGGRVVVTTVSDNLASQMRVILCRLGVYNTWCIAKARENICHGVVVSHRRAHFLTIPRGHSSELLSWTSRWSGETPEIKKGSKRNLSNEHILFRVSRVECVRKMDETDDLLDVYCLEVENDHSFVVQNAVAVENCLADYVQCSKCGKVMGDNDPNCKHLNNEMLQIFEDEDGIERVVAELCGRLIKRNGKWVGDPKSVRFIEASWVDKPAFTGAVLNHYVGGVPKDAAKVLTFPTWRLAETMEDLFRMRVADRAGMMVLRVARAELLRRRREAMIERIAGRIP